MPPDKGLACHAKSGRKSDKRRLTYAFSVNADGSDRHQPLIIGRFCKPHCFQGKTGEQLGFYYRHNLKAWMQTALFIEWIESWDQELKAEG